MSCLFRTGVGERIELGGGADSIQALLPYTSGQYNKVPREGKRGDTRAYWGFCCFPAQFSSLWSGWDGMSGNPGR